MKTNLKMKANKTCQNTCQTFHINQCANALISILYQKANICSLLPDKVPVVQSLSSQEMDTATRVKILDETDCISHSTNTLGEGMNPIILPLAMGKYRTDQVLQPWRGNQSKRRKTEFKPVKLRLKIDLVSYPARAKGLGKYDN